MRKAAGLCLSAAIALSVAFQTSAVATSERDTKTETAAKSVEETEIEPTRAYDDLFSETRARSLLMTAKQYMRHHNYNKAIPQLSRAIKLDPDDPDVRCLYAEALEEKLSHQ
ncbi:MAG: hypothetical protein C0508_30765, partial [Cyanobacteria bacterium PR.023]|nr:hypothetical protein [Cyanobacteria bacterium PR.023]